MKKILTYIILGFYIFSLTPSLFAYSGEISLTNGTGTINSSGGNYKHSTSINDGIVLAGTTPDYRLSSGMLSIGTKISNEHITFIDYTPLPSETAPTTRVDVSVTVRTTEGFLKTVKYRVSSLTPPESDAPYTDAWDATQPGQANLREKKVEATVTAGLSSGRNYIQWFAQNDHDDDGSTVIYVINVQSGQTTNIEILEPKSVSSLNPQIEATIFSTADIRDNDKLDVIITNDRTGEEVFKKLNYAPTDTGPFFKTGKFIAKYNDLPDSRPLQGGQKYTLSMEYRSADATGGTATQTSTFDVSTEPISLLMPYPSPFNPKKHGDGVTLKYVLAENSSVTINIYDRAGKLVRQVISSESRSAGENTGDKWDCKNYAGDSVANGVYICEVIAKSGKENRRYASFAVLRK